MAQDPRVSVAFTSAPRPTLDIYDFSFRRLVMNTVHYIGYTPATY